MSGFDFFLFGIVSFAAQHLVPFGLVAIVIIVALSVVFFGTGPAVLAFLRSRVGQLIIALVFAGVIGWELKGFVDDAVTLRRQIIADRREADRALAEQTARTKAALATAAEARRQAEAQRAIADAARDRESTTADTAVALRDQVDAFDAKLADAKQHSAAERERYRLSGATADWLRRLATEPGPRRP